MDMSIKEWLEADGLGAFASGTAEGTRTRRYHALLLTATNPPTGRIVLVNGFDAWVETENGKYAISSQRYAPDFVGPDGAQRIESFNAQPWPTWIFRLEDGTRVRQEIFVLKNSAQTVVAWQLLTGGRRAILTMRPFLSGRDYHSMHHENSAFQFAPEIRGHQVSWHPYTGLPAIHATTNGQYSHEPFWYKNFEYLQERERGLDDTEDLASPGFFCWNLAGAEATCIFSVSPEIVPASEARMLEIERRKKFCDPLELAADSYLVARKKGKTIVAGYPWFTDWGRDAFIAIRGLCLETGRLDDARDILLEWAGAVSQGMLPNRFPDQGEEAEYNSVDASLWYVIAVSDFLQAARGSFAASDSNQLLESVEAILNGYEKGTRFGIRKDTDSLLAAGEPGYQLTWMDARVNGREITPRIGKPVEIQALWLNALAFAATFSKRWRDVFDSALFSFREKFWNEAGGFLYDVVDVDHHPGKVDDSFRPNQILAIGGLPLQLFEGEKARKVVDAVQARLLTPMGLRSLAPGSPGYAEHYSGGVAQRDGIYHQGTVWPWLIGPFVEAWLRVYKDRSRAALFLEPLLQHINEAGLGHVSEIADAESPFTPRGCPFQAWSVGELLRARKLLRIE